MKLPVEFAVDLIVNYDIILYYEHLSEHLEVTNDLKYISIRVTKTNINNK